MIRLLALDLDGTVLGPGTEIAPACRSALQAAERAGVQVTLASGRMLRSAAAVRDRLGLHGPLLAYNGGLVRLPDGGGWTDPVPLEAAHAVGALCRARGYFVQAYLGDDLYVPFEDGRAEAYAGLAGVAYTVDPATAYAPPAPPTKLLIIEPAERQPEVRAAPGAWSSCGGGDIDGERRWEGRDPVLSRRFPHPGGLQRVAGLPHRGRDL